MTSILSHEWAALRCRYGNAVMVSSCIIRLFYKGMHTMISTFQFAAGSTTPTVDLSKDARQRQAVE